MVTVHHVVADGWSLPIVVQQMFAGYQGQRLPIPAPYRDFVAWLPVVILILPAPRGVRCSMVLTPRRW
ncbi:condensation domain protein [Mycobacterium xenopi 4042]|uniref:Condensation domain protein n=1 Tax=Mycobacterium xenopi 4042 TaxID=1299334 RepID=X7YLZ4_MYCXE|nr:condensation domain protein [Mycobacterium xenopi 4042]